MREVTYVAERSCGSPLGDLVLRASATGLRRLAFADDADHRRWRREDIGDGGAAERILDDTVKQLDEYFDRRRRMFELPLEPVGTDFQVSVWRALVRVPYGSTVSYATQAGWIGRPAAVRAVGGANGRNPLPIVLPCHRVVGADGSLTGYGGGLWRKTWLLELEAEQAASNPQS